MFSHMKFKSTNTLAVGILILAGFTLYANTLPNAMFWDDNDFILRNAFVQNAEVGKFFTENVIAGAGLISNYWRPVLLLVFSVQWHLFHAWTPGYHFINMSVHIADGVLLFFILLRLFGRRDLALGAAAIFLAHPLATEAVAYVNSLGDSLSALFMFSGILLFQKKYRVWPLVMYCLALMSKETAIVMPALLFLIIFFSEKQESCRELSENPPVFSVRKRLASAAKKIWPYLLIAALYVFLRATVLNFQNTFNLLNDHTIFTQSVVVRVLTFFRILAVYAGLLFWPSRLHMERTVEISTVAWHGDVFWGGAIFMGLFLSAVLARKRWPVVSFGFLWFLVALAPTSNIAVPINGLLYEHWLYVPLIGIFLAILWVGIRISEIYPNAKIALPAFFCLILFAFGIRTVLRNADWRDPIEFYIKTLAYAPASYRLWNNLGMTYAERHEYQSAEDAYQKAIALDPHSSAGFYNLANVYRDTGKADEAIAYYKKSLAADPKFFYAEDSLLSVYLNQKEYAEARKLLEAYVGEERKDAGTFFSLFQIAMRQNDYRGAMAYLKHALSLAPDDPILLRAYADTTQLWRLSIDTASSSPVR